MLINTLNELTIEKIRFKKNKFHVTSEITQNVTSGSSLLCNKIVVKNQNYSNSLQDSLFSIFLMLFTR